MKTKTLIFYLIAFVMFSKNGVFAQSNTDSTFIDASIETYTPNFEKISPIFEQFLEQNSVRIDKKNKDYFEIKYTLIIKNVQFSELKKKLNEWNCQTITLSETTRYISQEKNTIINKIDKLQNNIKDSKESLLTAETESRRESLQERISEDKAKIREYENDIRELSSKNGTVVLKITLMREQTTPNTSMKIRFVNMPGFEYSVFVPENSQEGISAEYYNGYMLKYLFTRGKSYITIGAFKASEVPPNDSLMYSDIFNFSFGQDFYSRYLGRGGRKFLNLYSGYNIGLLTYKGKASSHRNIYISPAIGIELFKNNFMLLDTKMTYILPFSENNLNLRGLQFAAALNFVF
ncbi:MAG: hypothetical protein II937_04995 [Bacteroidales bacterium]|nr:hypothetical protein [Bacteroidales bacterium]